ncbi:hypothetical protein UFOVP148_40 [uncultured Caudovirales phage]|uniref:Uncharacterized protein n=1 Tax=uncultured Caudovirales phage TaxID=2100421 RepID=A0A6J7W8G3_9CAUD|nr:hypothetical protein UFOVP148_40 [uncultured Caudovirales phage]
MSNFAKVKDGIVQDVIVADLSFFDGYVDTSPGKWIQTSYNSYGNVHYGPNGQPDGLPALRANYAGIGYTYDEQADVFYAPQPYPSWTLNPTTWLWEAPVAKPLDGVSYYWDEPTLSWIPLPHLV